MVTPNPDRYAGSDLNLPTTPETPLTTEAPAETPTVETRPWHQVAPLGDPPTTGPAAAAHFAAMAQAHWLTYGAGITGPGLSRDRVRALTATHWWPMEAAYVATALLHGHSWGRIEDAFLDGGSIGEFLWEWLAEAGINPETIAHAETPTAPATPLSPHIHHDHVHPSSGVEQVGWLGQTGAVYALDDEAGVRTEPGGFSPLYQSRGETCGHQIREAARPEIVTLCGSTRFKDAINAENARLTMAGHLVISLGVFGHTDMPDVDWTTGGSDAKRMLDDLHKRKIDLADRVHVVNPGGYIGESTRGEIAYAVEHGKPVTYLTPDSLGGEPR
jgi:hypothetical protein